jgi:putative holliday junction resolvase
MTITSDPTVFLPMIARGKRLLGLDLGTKTIGLAMATFPDGVPTPLYTLHRTKFQNDAKELLALVGKEKIGGIVLGLPLNMDGSAGPRVQGTKAFARNLQPHGPPPILLFDERLTSMEAEDEMRIAGMNARLRAQNVDAMAARLILRDALEALQAINLTDRTQG